MYFDKNLKGFSLYKKDEDWQQICSVSWSAASINIFVCCLFYARSATCLTSGASSFL